MEMEFGKHVEGSTGEEMIVCKQAPSAADFFAQVHKPRPLQLAPVLTLPMFIGCGDVSSGDNSEYSSLEDTDDGSQIDLTETEPEEQTVGINPMGYDSHRVVDGIFLTKLAAGRTVITKEPPGNVGGMDLHHNKNEIIINPNDPAMNNREFEDRKFDTQIFSALGHSSNKKRKRNPIMCCLADCCGLRFL